MNRVKSWGFRISDQPVNVDARVLPPPMLTLGNKQTITPRDGVYDLRGKSFNQPARINRWCVAVSTVE